MIIPGAVVTGLLALPMLDKLLPRGLAHIAACSFLLTLLGCGGFLTYQAMAKDSHSDSFRIARRKADAIAGRARHLAEHEGIPPEGSAYLLKLDPLSRGGELFSRKCAGCHNMGGEKTAAQWAPDLKDYGSPANSTWSPRTWPASPPSRPTSPRPSGAMIPR